jgi:uncharacterized protein (TIGR02246 family)
MKRKSLSVAAGVLLAAAACRTTSIAASPPDTCAAARSAVQVVQAQLESYNARDLDAFAATYADDVMVTNAKAEVLVRGKAALRERYGGIFQKYPKNHCEIAERRTEGDRIVVDHEIITGRGPDKPDPWDVGWVRYEVECGLIRWVALP